MLSTRIYRRRLTVSDSLGRGHQFTLDRLLLYFNQTFGITSPTEHNQVTNYSWTSYVPV